ncbi:TonB-dependent receptor [Nostoc sp. PA-18-2419]|uniref:TonB-dependent receptor n=1 Tax=Nostoc sp. PA-18-2419 TaxID=2575443 RepID=UPI0011091CAF|nr:TonB-dependent receptor [Nostoc sp. PA-18-2419]
MINQWQQVVLIISALLGLGVQPVWAQTVEKNISNISSIREIKLPLTTAQMLVQSPVSEIVQVTDVKANPTNKGVEVILQTSKGQELQLVNRSAGDNFIVDVPNAQLRLPSGEAFTFRSDKPIAGITQITVTNFNANTIRVTVTGETLAPQVELYDSPNEGLIFSVASTAPRAQQPQPQQNQTQPSQSSTSGDEPIELVVTGEQDGYNVPDASTATRTDTPLRDIPQSIQVVPQQVLKDQQVIQASEALRNVSGVQQSIPSGGSAEDIFSIRGFEQNVNLRDGFRDVDQKLVETANLERIEVLKGPASVLYGNVDPGGAINFVTKQPLRDPFYSFGVQAGSFGLVRPTADLSGPLNPERTLLYRLNAVYQHGGYFRDLDQEIERYFVSPVLNWKIDEHTNLTLEFEHLDEKRPLDDGLIAFGRGVANIPFDRILNERDDNFSRTQDTVGYRLEHNLSEDLKLRSRFRFTVSDSRYRSASAGSLNEQTGELSRNWADIPVNFKNYLLQNDLIGKFSTGRVKHTLLFGVDLERTTNNINYHVDAAPSINIFNPIYGTVPRPYQDQLPVVYAINNQTNFLGIFLQDQVTVTDNLKLLLGGRFDLVDQKSTSDQQDDAFTPRVGIVYQPIQPISLYASFSKSFQPNSGTLVDGSLLPAERGTQYEVGVKGEFLNNKLTLTLAAYEITKSNVATTDPNNTNFVIPVGEQRSRGIELDIAGEILPGWNIIASYANTDAKVTKSNDGQQGNQLYNVPYNAASLWTTYELQTGSLQGLGFGLGLFYVGDRQGDLANDFKVDSYLRTDASVFYRRNKLSLGLNFKNLFNVDYIEASRTRTTVNPGAPFTVQGTVSWEF